MLITSEQSTQEPADNEPPEQIRMIAIDIDGTLLTPEKRLTARTKAAIQAAQAAGIIVTLATARRYGNSSPFADLLELSIPLITCDGALIMQHPAGSIMHTQLLADTIAQQAADILVTHHVQPIIHHVVEGTEETWSGLATFDNPDLADYVREQSRIVRHPHHRLCQGQPDPLRVVGFASYEAISAVIPEIAQLSCAWNAIERGNYGCAEITVMRQGCSKATGVATLATHLGIALTQVMAIGDNHNDSEMLEEVGWGVAMGHAPARVRARANAVTATNREDGAAQAIERFALGR